MEIPESHPRYRSLKLREVIAEGYENGLVDRTGLIAHGRGEAFDYLLGERTHPEANEASKVAAAMMLAAEHAVISVNGNTAVLVPRELVELAAHSGARLEVNIFHRTGDRQEKLIKFLESQGAENVLGRNTDATIPGLSQPRSACSGEGIYKADVVFVPLEDGDRAEALVKMGKKVIVVDLNPLSRSARCASVTIVDNLTRAMGVIIEHTRSLKAGTDNESLNVLINEFNNEDNLKKMIKHLDAERGSS